MRMESHGFGIDRYGIGVAGQVRQVAAMQAYGHCLPTSWNRSDANYRSIWKEASASGASSDKKIGGDLPAIALRGTQHGELPVSITSRCLRSDSRTGAGSGIARLFRAPVGNLGAAAHRRR